MTSRKFLVAVAAICVAALAAPSCFLFGERKLTRDFLSQDKSTWVTVLDPEATAGGYTLLLYKRRLPYIIDALGRTVHFWPDVRAKARARLESDGRLVLINDEDDIEEYDWDGNLLQHIVMPEGSRAHHDFNRAANGNLLVLGQWTRSHWRDKPENPRGDFVVEFSPKGEIVWIWASRDHIDKFQTWDTKRGNPTHMNSIRELGANPIFDAGDKRFDPQNLLVSARNLSTIFIIDRKSGEIVWQLTDGLDYQHDPLMLGAEHEHAGNIMLFNNGLRDKAAYRSTRVQVIDPLTLEVTWEYTHPMFYSSVEGVAQPLWNGNTMITSSRGGRAFEVTDAGKIVWQWEPNFSPMRPIRYPIDYTPQLAVFEPQPLEARSRETGYIDKALFEFLIPEGPHRRLDEWERRVTKETAECRRLLIPDAATLMLGYGLHRDALDGKDFTARFAAEVHGGDDREPRPLFEDVVRSSDQELVRDITVSLAEYARVWVELCVEAIPIGETNGVKASKAIVWESPQIRPGLNVTPQANRELSKADLEDAKIQLREIGYIQ